ncbi:hypothetical protein [Enterococcus faecalis]|uniref:hypothetical protein n=1 Tax=Enterococcus faecalis TaxID=1351 RepID=UPI0019D1F8F6
MGKVLEGLPLETVYFYALVGSAVLAFLLIIFGDVFNFDGPVDPMLIIPWIAFTSLFGYLGEELTAVNSWLILIVSGILSTIIVFFLNFYVLIPLKNSEATISISEKDMEGRVATVITPIPVRGMGEIQLKSVTGSLSRPAAFYVPQEVAAPRGSEVLIIELKERVCYVIPYEGSLKI